MPRGTTSSLKVAELIREEGELARQVGIPRASDINEPIKHFGDIPQDKLDIAAKRGTRIHEMIEYSIDNNDYGLAGCEDEYRGYMKSFLDFWLPYKRNNRHHKHFTEMAIGSVCNNSRGTADLLSIRSTRETCWIHILDWKATYKLRPENPVQLGIYARAVAAVLEDKDIGGTVVITGSVVRLKKDGSEAEVMPMTLNHRMIAEQLHNIFNYKYENSSDFKRHIDEKHHRELTKHLMPDKEEPIAEDGEKNIPYPVCFEDGKTIWGVRCNRKRETGDVVSVVTERGRRFQRTIGEEVKRYTEYGVDWFCYTEHRIRRD